MKLKFQVFSLFILFGGIAAPLYPDPETAARQYLEFSLPEADPFIFQTALGSSEIGLILSGRWKALASYSLGFLYDPENGEWIPSPFPLFQDGFHFQQYPDLQISLWYMRRYFFTTMFNEADRLPDTFLLGYYGREAELIRSFSAGKGILFESEVKTEDYRTIPVLGTDPAVFLRLGTEISDHRLLAQYSLKNITKKYFYGKNELIRYTIPLTGYIRKRYYRLPDREVGSITVYLESTSGDLPADDGRYYRKADPSEVSVSAGDGLIFFAKPVTERVLVTYTKNGLYPGDPMLGRDALPGLDEGTPDPLLPLVDFNIATAYNGYDAGELFVMIAGQRSLLLEPMTRPSPFECLFRYETPQGITDSGTERSCAVGNTTDSPFDQELDRTFLYTFDSIGKTIQVQRVDSSPSDPFIGFPFIRVHPRMYTYGRGYSFDNGKVITIIERHAVQSLSIDTGVDNDTIVLLLNGRRHFDFSYDAGTGAIDIHREVFPQDQIEITYRAATAEASTGTLLLDLKNTFTLSENIMFTLDASMKWSVGERGYSEKYQEMPGYLSLAAGAKIKTDPYSISAGVDISLVNPDTSGVFRLASFGSRTTSVPINAVYGYPASVPISPVAGRILTRENRGKLLYRNFAGRDIYGNPILRDYSWTASTQYEYRNGNPTGPYPAGAQNDNIAEAVMCLEYDLGATKQWVGSLFEISGVGQDLDLSNATGISLFIKNENPEHGLSVFIQAGAVSEDLDDDGILDYRKSAYLDSFTFNDTAHNAVLHIGAGEGVPLVPDSEDINGNNILDPEIEELVVSFPAILSGTTDWQKVEISFSRADRERLCRTRAVRILIVRDSPGSYTGRIIVGNIQVSGSTFAGSAVPAGNITVREVSELFVSGSPYRSIADTFPDTPYPIPDTSTNSILKCEWNGITSDSVIIDGYTSAVDHRDYENLTMFFRVTGLSSDDQEMSVFLNDKNARGIALKLPVSNAPDWRRLDVHLRDGSVTVDGRKTAVTASIDDSGLLSSIRIEVHDSASGILEIDEIHFSHAILNGAIRLYAALSFALPDLISGIPIVTGTKGTIYGEISAAIDELQENSFTTGGSLESTIMFTDVGLKTEYVHEQLSRSFLLSHSILFPSFDFPITIRDKFSRAVSLDRADFSRETLLSFSLIPFQLNVSNMVSADQNALTRVWKGSGVLQFFQTTLSAATLFSVKRLNAENGLTGYFGTWSGSFLYMPLSSNYADLRTSSLEFSSSLKPNPLGVNLTASMKTEYDPGGLLPLKTKNRIYFDLPLLFGGSSDHTVSLRGERMVTISSHSENSDIFSDLRDGMDNLWSQSYFYTGIPGVELFSESTLYNFTSVSGSYQSVLFIPSCSVDYKRTIDSGFLNFIFPGEVSLKIEKRYARHHDTVTNQLVIESTLRNKGINIFGSDSAHPVFMFYDVDEILSALTMSAVFDGSTEIEKRTLGWLFSITIEDKNVRKIDLSNLYSMRMAEDCYQKNDTAISYSWYSDVPSVPIFSALTTTIKKQPLFVHMEKLQVQVISEDELTISGSFSHESRLMYPDSGYLSFHFGIGAGSQSNFETSSDRIIHSFGILFGISAEISF